MPRTLAGRYRLERRLGRGGMGTVYAAVDVALDRPVAVKVVRDEWVHNPMATQRFRREARAVAGFAHPNVVTVYDYGVETGSRVFLVMELLHGTTLREELRRSGRLSPARTLDVLRGVGSAVGAAHERGFIHRDLKPENIFLVEHGGPAKVLDFGVAKPLARVDAADPGAAPETEVGVLVGTIGYISPEHLLGDSPDVSWDLWALAVVAYECPDRSASVSCRSRGRRGASSCCRGRHTPLSAHLAEPRRAVAGLSSTPSFAADGGAGPARPRSSSGSSSAPSVLRPPGFLDGEGWNKQLDEPKTKIVGVGGPHSFSASTSGAAMVFAVKAPGITIRELKLTSTAAATGVFIVSTTAFPASDHPVVVEHNHFDVVNFCVLTAYSAAFPVRIDHNKFIGNASIEARWMGFTLRPIATYPGDEPAVPQDASGRQVRHSVEITDNTIIKRPGSTNWSTLTVYGWLNYGCPERGPETACRRMRPDANTPYVYQYGDGDNGPVLISGNDITVSTPGVTVWTILLGSESGGVNDVILWRNKVTGVCSETLVLGPYGHNNIIMDNDFSGVRAWTQAAILAADTIVYSNSFGALDPIPPNKQQVPAGFLPPVLFLASAQYYPAYTPVPNPVENCLIAKNDYRPSGARSEAILIASRAEFSWARYGGTGTEVMHNVDLRKRGVPAGNRRRVTADCRSRSADEPGDRPAVRPRQQDHWTVERRPR